MNKIKELMDAWKNNGYINPDAIISGYQAMELLIVEVEELKAQISNLGANS
jgi:hypothetical protein